MVRGKTGVGKRSLESGVSGGVRILRVAVGALEQTGVFVSVNEQRSEAAI
jgi:hypothetical protein